MVAGDRNQNPSGRLVSVGGVVFFVILDEAFSSHTEK